MNPMFAELRLARLKNLGRDIDRLKSGVAAIWGPDAPTNARTFPPPENPFYPGPPEWAAPIVREMLFGNPPGWVWERPLSSPPWGRFVTAELKSENAVTPPLEMLKALLFADPSPDQSPDPSPDPSPAG